MKSSMRILSLLLALLMVISSMVVVTTVGVSAAEDHGTQPTTWWKDQVVATYGENATPADVFSSGDGTSDQTAWIIDTPIQLAYFAYYLESGALNGNSAMTYFYLRGNGCNGTFDMSAHQWTPIGSTNTTAYKFKLSGRTTCKVTGLKLTASPNGHVYENGCAMFALVQNGSVVENLTLDVKILNPVLANPGFSNPGVAGIVAIAKGGVTVRNCNVNIDLDVEGTGGQSYYAGAVGKLSDGNCGLQNTKVTGSINVTTPAGTQTRVGGAIGYHDGYSINGNTNEASISVTSDSPVIVGGVYAYSTTFGTGTFTNKGEINVNLTGTSSSYSYVGGVIGVPRIVNANYPNLVNGEDGKTSGSITVTTAGAPVSVGGVVAGITDTSRAFAMSGLTNYGEITLNVNAASSNTNYVGGIFGKYDATVTGGTMTNSENKGAINVVFNSSLATGTTTAIGGLIGHQIHLAMTDSQNSGAITVTNSSAGTQYVGGITGLMHTSSNGGNTIGGTDHTGKSDYVVNNGAIILTDRSSYDSNNAGRYIGGIVGYYMSNTLNGCINNGDITYNSSESGSTLGGIVGTVARASLTIQNCTNNGALLVSNYRGYGSSTYMGGIAAHMQLASTIDSCTNNGLVRQTKGLGQQNVYMGGLVATLKDGVVKNSVNTGTVQTDNLTTGGNERHALHIGGAIGYAGGASTLTNLSNSGKLDIVFTQGAKEGDSAGGMSAGNTGSYIAGVVGKAEGTTKLTDLSNSGHVYTSTNNGKEANSTLKAGGVANLRENAVATNLTNTGKVEFTSNQGATLYLGGVLGEIAETAKATNLSNSADVSVNKTTWTGSDVGGIVGRYYASATLDTAVNSGNVDMTTTGNSDSTAGGIIGIAVPAATAGVATDCTNYGSISAAGLGNNGIGGILGRVTEGTAAGTLTLKNCANVGTVKESSLSGGILGHARAENNLYVINLENCISYGAGTKYALVGSLRNSALNVKNTFGDTEQALNYYNQNSGRKIEINGVEVAGNDIAYTPAGNVYAHLELATLDKARLRLDAFGTDESGLRFDSYIDKDCYDEIKAMTGVSIELATIIAPTINLGVASVDAAYDKLAAMDALGGKRYTVVPFAQDFLDAAEFGDASGEKLYFAAAINYIREENYNLGFSAIGYAKITIGDFSFIVYADYDKDNSERSRSVAQVATMAFEDRATESIVIDGYNYRFKANADNACYLGDYSLYSNDQLNKLRAYSNYVNNGTIPTGLTVNGVSISEYQIVYAQSPIYKTYGSNTGKTLYGDLGNVTMTDTATVAFGDVLMGATYDYDYQTAIALQSAIKDTFGVTLNVVPDYSIGADAAITSDDVITPEAEYEILVGQTNRGKTQSALILNQNPDAYTLNINDNDIVICGGSYGATWQAMLALKALLGERANTDYNLKMAGDMSGYADMTIIACVGDSITRGSQGLPDNDFGGTNGADDQFGGTATGIYLEQFLSYPANLQRELWQTAYVYNFGRGSSTVGNYDASNYYATSTQGKACFATSDSDVDFDLVFMMHGTNDSGCAGGAYGWDADDKDHFYSEVKGLMDRILEGSPDATFVINNVPHRFDTNFTTAEQNTMAMAVIQKETAERLYDDGYDVYHYDMNAYTRQNLVKDGVACDGCYEAPDADIDSTGEINAHGYYYNCETPCANQDGTHPNFRGYNKIAEGLLAVVDYIVNGAEAPVYMIDIQ